MKKLVVVGLLVLTCTAQAGVLDETRYCGVPKRDAKGQIVRRADVLAAFQRVHPCPSTGKKQGACPGWALDHVVSLACGGCDEVSNLQWLPNQIKSAKGASKDRWERKVYGHDPAFADTHDCTFPTAPIELGK